MELIVQGQLEFGRFVDRPNRFTVVLKTVSGSRRCHLRDPGRLSELLKPQAGVLFVEKSSPRRRTDCEVVAIWDGKCWTIVNSGLHNELALELISAGLLPELGSPKAVKTEVRFGNSRVDILIEGRPPTLVEVKGCTLVRDGLALFPDAPTQRGTRHVLNLIEAIGMGFRAAALFLVMRPDAKALAPNAETDLAFAEALARAHRSGVMLLAHTFRLRGRSIEPASRIPVLLNVRKLSSPAST